MNAQLNLKQIEKKAFRSTYEDGLWDIYIGIVVACMGTLMLGVDSESFPLAIFLLAFGGIAVGYLIFWGGKKYITLPRMGQVKFGPARQQRKRTLAALVAAIVALQIAIVLLTAAGWLFPAIGALLQSWLPGENLERLLVASVGALFVGPAMLLLAYFNDFVRGYYHAALTALGVFFMILFDQPLILIAAGALIAIPGVALLVRFLQKYPLPQRGEA
jgi:hypothetical protein